MEKLKELFKKVGKIGFGSLSTILFFVVWYGASVTGILNKGIIPSPVIVFEQLFNNIVQGKLTSHIFLTFKRAGIGFLAALVIGLILGFILQSTLKNVNKFIMPVLKIFEKLNPFALFPLFMLFFGIGELSKVIIVFWVAVWPIVFHTADGFKNIDKLLLKSARTMGASTWIEFYKVKIPAALPDIITGIKFSSQIAFTLVISAEMLSSTAGLGWFISIAKTEYNLPNLYGGAILVAVLGIILNKILSIIEKNLTSWKQEAF